jgi:outer membrane protein TolC
MTALGLVLLVTTLAAASPPDTSVRPLSLHDAVALAERNAPAVIHAMGQTRTTAASVRAAYGAFLPSISLSAGANRQLPTRKGQVIVVNGQVQTLSSEPWSYSTGLSTNLVLFGGGQRFFQLQESHAQADAASVNLGEQRGLAALAAKQQFFNVLASIELEGAAAAQLEESRQQLAMSVLHLQARTVTRSDSLRSEILVHNAQLAVTQARTSLDQANASLTRAVGTPYPVTAARGDSIGDENLSLDDAALRQLAITGPAVQLAESQRSAARAALHITWTGYLPSVTASYGRTGSGASDQFALTGNDLQYSGALRLSVSLPVFDQLQRESRISQARAVLEDAEVSCRDARLAALETLAQSLGAYRAATERVATQAATVEAAEEDLREHQEQYNVGISTLLDVLTSRTMIDQARHDLIQARYDRRIAKAQLEALIGRSL